MGVTYKLRQDIIDYILELRKSDSSLGCRKLVDLINGKFSVKVSKSSVNSILKSSGLSMPVGRRSLYTFDCQEALSLKAADSLLGGCDALAEIISRRLNKERSDALDLAESVFYFSFFESGQGPGQGSEDIIAKLVGKKITVDEANAFIKEIESKEEILTEIQNAIQSLTRQARSIKLSFPDNNEFYLDARLYTLWPSNRTPASLRNNSKYISDYLRDELSSGYFSIFMAPGYGKPKGYFLELMSKLNSSSNKAELTSYGNSLQELMIDRLDINQGTTCVFGLWPWQYQGTCLTRLTGEYKALNSLNKVYYVAPASLEMTEQLGIDRVILTGCAIKTALEDPFPVFVFSNKPKEAIPAEELACIYLKSWPDPIGILRKLARNIEECDVKNELQTAFHKDGSLFSNNPPDQLKAFLSAYIIFLRDMGPLLPSRPEKAIC